MSKRRLSDGRVVDLTPEEITARNAEHAAHQAQAAEVRERQELREKLLDQLLASETPKATDVDRYRALTGRPQR